MEGQSLADVMRIPADDTMEICTKSMEIHANQRRQDEKSGQFWIRPKWWTATNQHCHPWTPAASVAKNQDPLSCF